MTAGRLDGPVDCVRTLALCCDRENPSTESAPPRPDVFDALDDVTDEEAPETLRAGEMSRSGVPVEEGAVEGGERLASDDADKPFAGGATAPPYPELNVEYRREGSSFGGKVGLGGESVPAAAAA